MGQKGISSLVGILIVFIAAISAGVIIYYQYLRSSNELVSPIIITQQPPASHKTANWEDLLPEIQKILEKNDIASDHPASIDRKADITGDGIDEALVSTGMCGASTCFDALFQLENNKPVMSQFEMEDGKIDTPTFGIGGSVTHIDSINFWPEKQAIYTFGYTTGPSDYKAEWYFAAYQWDPQNKLFAYNKELSEEVKNLPEVQKSIKETSVPQ